MWLLLSSKVGMIVVGGEGGIGSSSAESSESESSSGGDDGDGEALLECDEILCRESCW